MSAFSANRRRILSLWLPRLPIDRIKRLERTGFGSRVDYSCEASTLAGLSPPLRERVGERGTADTSARGLPLSLTLPRKGGGNPSAGASLTLDSDSVPIVVVAKDHNAIVLYAVDESAARSGLSIGLPLANARAICPELIVHDADEAADRQTLEDIADWCDRFTPLVALDLPHGLFLDITGCAHLFGGEAALLRQLTTALIRQGFAVSAAIAATSVCARTLTRCVPDTIVADGGEAAAIASFPVAALGAGEVITGGLRRAGLKTIGDIAARGRHELSARFGARFTTLLAHALGEGDAPISPRKPAPDYIVEKRFPEPIATEAVITLTLSSLAEMLVKAMDRQGKGARRLEASFFRTDGAVRTIAVDTGRPVTRREMIDRLFRERLDALNDPLDPGFGFDLVRLSASRTEIVVQQQRDLDATVHDNDEVSALVDRIAARLGGRRVVVHLPQDTHIPERAALTVPAQQALAAANAAAWPERTESEPPLRPIKLFERPEPIKVPFAMVPDGPPHHFTWRRVTHVVSRVEGPERIAMEWWQQDGQTLTRDYFRIEDQDGRRFWIFRDGLYERELIDKAGKPIPAEWFMHGLFA